MKINRIIAALALMMAFHFESEAQNLVTNGDFETGDFTGWSLTSVYYGGQNSVIVTTNYYANENGNGMVHSGTYAAQFTEYVAQNGGMYYPTSSTISQSLHTQLDTSYLLSFWLACYNTGLGAWAASWNGTQVAYTYGTWNGWTNIQIVVTASGTNTALQFGFYPANGTSYSTTFLDDVSVAPLPSGYNHLAAQVTTGGSVQLSFVGIAGSNYALDRAFNLAVQVWVPQATNIAGAGGVLVFTNTPNPATNNFWRIRSVP